MELRRLESRLVAWALGLVKGACQAQNPFSNNLNPGSKRSSRGGALQVVVLSSLRQMLVMGWAAAWGKLVGGRRSLQEGHLVSGPYVYVLFTGLSGGES